ncbi:hypothetical protein GOBAR_DD04271 [Gossypium barbadense]|nr:hypothetical protein GOBAR_DD04271 [Gossypium barbadense]
MDDKFFVCVYFDGIILTITVGCIFECRQQIAMRFNRNISLDDMKGRINAKIVRHCGKRISKIFYKFSVSTNPIKFTKMELVDDEDVETMIALYCGNVSDKNAPIHLFVELAGMEQNEDVNAYGEEHGAQESYMVALTSYVDSESTIGGIDIYLNITPDIDVVVDDGYDGSDHCDQEVNSDSDPDVDDVPDDIDDEDVNNDGNINASSVGDQMRRILIHNNPGPHMSLIDPDAAHVSEFSEYPEIIPAHRLPVNSDYEELFVGQRFESKEKYKAIEGCNWRVRAAFIQNSQMWEIRKFVGPHTCTSTRMVEDHRKFDSKTICTCIMPMVKDMPTIKVSILITEMHARFQYRVSYRKAWIAKQMAMKQLYGDYDSSYNELQRWIAAMRDYWNLSFLNTYTAYELEPHIFGQRMIRLENDMEGQTNTSFRQWLGTMEPWKWAQSFDEGFHYGQMTTNLVEGVNAVLLKTRHLLIASVFSATFYRLATLMPRMSQQ